MNGVTTETIAVAHPLGGALLREGCAEDAPAILDLIVEHQLEGWLLPRTLPEIEAHAHRFVVAEENGRIIGCAELAPLSRSVAEVRSLVVRGGSRSAGVGTLMIDELITRARAGEFEKICAFTHSPAYFVHRGFSIVPHAWLPEKIATNCQGCARFRRCGQYAVVLPLLHVRG